MFNITTRSIEWGGRTLTLETGKIARQADGAVMVTYGETSLLCTAVAAKSPKEGVDFFPLTVAYQEKAFAAGKIPGGFFKREGRPAEKEVLTSRLIDRPIRPLFPEGFVNETQVICTLLTHDLENDPDIPAMIGASAALAISGIPFNGPIGGARVAYIDGKYVLNPAIGFKEETDLDLVLAGTDSSVMMVESEANELTEEQMLGAVEFGHKEMQPVIKMINDMAKEIGKERWEVEKPDYSDLEAKLKKAAEKALREAYKEQDKQARQQKIAEAKEAAIATLSEEDAENELVVGKILKNLEKDIVRTDILKTSKRIDGRDTKTVRPIEAEVGFLATTHGSALFTRGETQAIAVATLGTAQDEQRIDALEGETTEHFMLHYNFPPYSVGEASMLRSPGRREIGHGKLAWRALNALMPSKEDFPYTIRIVSEITESNGSSSMATVCGSALAMMDAGVPLRAPAAGIAMGLIKEGKEFAVLSDILGDEDHLGDMDFKVAGTETGVTALQMDIKIEGITPEIMKIALAQANEGRLHILGIMKKAIDAPRADVNKNAPKITSMQINPDKIREVIGSGGSVIREICETSGAKIDIEQDGTVKVAAMTGEEADKAIEMIKNIVFEPQKGDIYDGTVVRIVDFGAFVSIPGKSDGLVHISEIADRHVNLVTDELEEGQVIKVKVLDIDRAGKIKLSMKSVDQETGEDLGNSSKSDSDEENPRRNNNKKKRASN